MNDYYKIKNGCLLRDGEEHIPHIEMEEAIAVSEQTADWLRLKRYIKDIISNLANGEGGSPSKSMDLIYYLVHSSPKYWDRDISELYLDGPYTKLLKKYTHKPVNAKCVYNLLYEVRDVLENKPSELKKTTKRYDISSYDSQQSDPQILQEIRKKSKKLYGVSVYLHGSLALRDHTSFSDIDDFVILSPSSWSDFNQFIENMSILHSIARSFHTYDPLQHHGHWVFTHFDLNCFNPAELPPKVLEYSLRMNGKSHIEISLLDDAGVYYRPLWSTVQTIRHMLARIKSGSINMFNLKKLVSSISLMPALLAQINGKELSKKSAISDKDRILSEDCIGAVEWATRIRKDWDQLSRFRWVKVFKTLNNYAPFNRVVAQEVSKRYTPDLGSEDILFLTDSVIESIRELSNQGANAIKESI